jgi:hypothetical protein
MLLMEVAILKSGELDVGAAILGLWRAFKT